MCLQFCSRPRRLGILEKQNWICYNWCNVLSVFYDQRCKILMLHMENGDVYSIRVKAKSLTALHIWQTLHIYIQSFHSEQKTKERKAIYFFEISRGNVADSLISSSKFQALMKKFIITLFMAHTPVYLSALMYASRWETNTYMATSDRTHWQQGVEHQHCHQSCSLLEITLAANLCVFVNGLGSHCYTFVFIKKGCQRKFKRT